jgi:uncharacterized membrane protein SirB2
VCGKKTNIVDYLSLKYLHMCFAGLSGGFFLVRGGWMLAGSPLLQRRWVRTVPHVIDTALLSTAVALAVWSSQYPLAQTWLTAKVLALIAYIVLGTIALKRGPTRTIRGLAYVAALLVLLYIASVAISKNPLVFMGAEVVGPMRKVPSLALPPVDQKNFYAPLLFLTSTNLVKPASRHFSFTDTAI